MENLDKSELEKKVNNVIDQVRPYLQADGGDIQLMEVTDDYVVNVKLIGACGSCAFSTMTLKNGVEATLQKVLPQIKEVVAV
ncbi:MAG: NifU family protein [Bacteroidales bacterium]|nr:NifU family protein [Bacteroidales bacterium]